MQSKYVFRLLSMIAVIPWTEASLRSAILGPSEHEEMMEKQVAQYSHASEMKRMDLESQNKLFEMMKLNETLQRHAIDRDAEVQIAKENTKKHQASAEVLKTQHVADQDKWKAVHSSNKLQILKEQARIREEEEKTKQAAEISRQKAEDRQREQIIKERTEMELKLAELQKEQTELELRRKEAERAHELNMEKLKNERLERKQKMEEDKHTHERYLAIIYGFWALIVACIILFRLPQVIYGLNEVTRLIFAFMKALTELVAACIIPSLFQIFKYFQTQWRHRANQGDYREAVAPPQTPINAPTEVGPGHTTDADVADNTAATSGRAIAEVGSATKSELTITQRYGHHHND